MNEQPLPWDDLKTVLAIAQAGSLSGAARSLGVSHATVYRRLGAAEQRLGVQLFHRGRGGYTPTAAGEDVTGAARRIESEVMGIERRVVGRDLLPSGTLRITTTDTLLNGLLSPVLAKFLHAHAEITLEVTVSNVLLSLSRRDADLAVRPTQSPPENLVGRRVGCVVQAIYGLSAAFPANHELPDFRAVDWIGPDDTLWYRQLETWMKDNGLDDRCRYRVDSLQGMQSGVRDGIGVAVLPCYLGDADPRLVRLGEPLPELAVDLWLLTHPDLRQVERIRVFMEFVATALRANVGVQRVT